MNSRLLLGQLLERFGLLFISPSFWHLCITSGRCYCTWTKPLRWRRRDRMKMTKNELRTMPKTDFLLSLSLSQQFVFMSLLLKIWQHSSLGTLLKVCIWVFLLKLAKPGLFYNSFSVFSIKHHYSFTTYKCEKCPSSIQCRDSNPRPSEHESPLITTRPGFVKLGFVSQLWQLATL